MTKIKKKEKCTLLYNDPTFWKAEIEKKKTGKGADNKFDANCWDMAAETYDDLESCPDYIRQVNIVTDMLRSRRAINHNGTVLDVACGTGTYAIKFAQECKHVKCVDISKAMLNELRKKQQRHGIENIETECSDWRTFNSEKKYHLVFVSMSPILRHTDTIDRLIELSSRHLCIITWAGIRENPILSELHEDIFGDPPPAERCHSFHAIFNYLFTSGYAPDVKFFHGCWQRTRSKEKAVNGLLWRLELNRKLSDAEKEKIYKKINAIAQDDIVTTKTRVRIAAMFVDKYDLAITNRCQ